MKEDKLSLTDAAIDKIIYHVSGGIDIQELLCFFEEFSRSGRECRDYPEISNKIYNMDYSSFESLKMFFGVSESDHDNVFENMIQSFDWIDDSRRIDNLVHFEQIKSAFSSVITHNLSTSYPQFKKDKKKEL